MLLAYPAVSLYFCQRSWDESGLDFNSIAFPLPTVSPEVGMWLSSCHRNGEKAAGAGGISRIFTRVRKYPCFLMSLSLLPALHIEIQECGHHFGAMMHYGSLQRRRIRNGQEEKIWFPDSRMANKKIFKEDDSVKCSRDVNLVQKRKCLVEWAGRTSGT